MKRQFGVAIMASIVALAFAVLATPATAASQKNQIKVHFLNMGVQPNAQGKLMMIENKAQTSFKIQVKQMAPGTYDVVLNGAVVDTLSVGPTGKAQVTHRARNKGKKAGASLPYDPAGGQVEIQAAGTAHLEADIPSTPEEACEKIEIEVALDNLGVVPGEAEAEFEEHFGLMEFEVEIEDAPPGAYELLVDGVKVADIEVGIDGRGEAEFASQPSGHDDDGDHPDDGDDDGDEGDDDGDGDHHGESIGHDGDGEDGDDDGDALDLLLTFDPRGKEITIVQDATVLFSVLFPLTPVL